MRPGFDTFRLIRIDRDVTPMANQPKPPVTRTIRREASVVLRFVETISEVYAEPAPSSSVFPPARPGLTKVAPVIELRRAAGSRGFALSRVLGLLAVAAALLVLLSLTACGVAGGDPSTEPAERPASAGASELTCTTFETRCQESGDPTKNEGCWDYRACNRAPLPGELTMACVDVGNPADGHYFCTWDTAQ